MLPAFWIKTAGLFLVRSGRSTAALSLMVVSAVAALVFLSSLAEGINDAMIQNSVGLYSGHISGFNLPHSLKPQNLKVEGVSSVLKRVSYPGIIFYGDTFEAITLIAVDPGEEKKNTALWKKTVQGSWPEQGEDTIFLSTQISDRLKVRSGDTVRFSSNFDSSPTMMSISGLYETGIDRLDRSVAFCPMDAIPETAGTWDAAIMLTSGADDGAVMDEYLNIQIPGACFNTWSDLMPDLKQLIDLNYICMNIVTILVFGVVSLGIGCAFTIFILKNLRAYGIMKAMGVTSFETSFLILGEILLMNLAASVIGLTLGVTAVAIVAETGLDLTAFTSHNQYFIVSGVIFPRLTLYSLCVPPVLALVFSTLAALWPVFIVKNRKTADILRSV
ncbi:MAG: FtsX-like permease family protein [Deltaproteobacteria bacterium]|nr:FtsX-like permease family protein [Deltaproteobacteria bacterium]